MTEKNPYRTLEALFERMAEIPDEALVARTPAPDIEIEHDDDPPIPETPWEREIRLSDEHDELGVFDGTAPCPNTGHCQLCDSDGAPW